MNGLLLTVSIVMNLLACGVLRNHFCKKEIESNADLHAFNAILSAFAALTLMVIALCSGSLCVPSLYTLGLGVVFGLATALCAVLHMKALETGPLSYTNVITSCAMVIPSLSGLMFFGESVTLGQWAGMVLLLISIVCAVDSSNSESGTSFKWLLACLGSFACSGAVGVMQKLHQSSAHREELSMFLIVAFAVSALFSLAMARRGAQTKSALLQPGRIRKLMFFSLICGVGVALCNQINLYLSGVMNAMIFFPTVNGGSMLLTTIAGVVFWREKLSRRQWVGLVVGGCAIFLLCGIV